MNKLLLQCPVVQLIKCCSLSKICHQEYSQLTWEISCMSSWTRFTPVFCYCIEQ